MLVACALAVALVRARRAHRAAIEERGWLLERERETAARSAVDAERARIASELHDIVSHNVSLMVVQAGAAREVLDTLPQEAAAAMGAVENAGRRTMTELRHLLGLLAPAQDGKDEPYGDGRGGRGGGGGGSGSGALEAITELAPQPSLSRLSPLIDRIAFAGLPVEVRISGEPRPLPAGIDVTAYRIIQEALTNALKHGDGVKAEVTVRYADHALRVEVLNSGPSVLSGDRAPAPAAPGRSVSSGATGEPSARAVRTVRADGTGRGLVGLRERVAVYGGDFDARRRLGGGYRVRARLPLERP
ncbi:sensor histidine kinase [Streptomyces sp. ISL-66]|nr:histidine kinase [Streptomyces sp. ISL-66]MBT2468657.1 sensor histidine kinase [Streptomyces sp. ISL-66]